MGPAEVTVVSVYERDRTLLETLHKLHVKPGVKLRLGRRAGKDVEFRVNGATVKLPLETARRIWVN